MTYEKVKELIVETLKCDADTISEQVDLKNDLGIDSLDAMELCMAIEEEFGIEIEEDAAVKFTTVKSIVEYIEKRVA